MSRRIEIELTSDRGDGTWTWRAAGARQPKGVVDAALLPAGAKSGDVLRAEIDVEIDGITVNAVDTGPARTRNEPQRIEVLGSGREDDRPVIANLTGRRGDRRERRPRRDREGGERRGGRERTGGRGEQITGEGERRERRDRRERRQRRERPPAPPPVPERPKPKRLRPGRAHRKAVLAELPPEQQPIAEQVLRGGLPAVRRAIEAENEKRANAGQPPINAPELLDIAEQLLPRLRTADWRDRAEAAVAGADELDLRDLRSVVVAADAAARTDETRALAADLRAKLDQRVEEELGRWLEDLRFALDAGRVVRALRLSSRPPKAGTILPPELRGALAEAASAALTADIGTDRWAAVLDATAFAPVRSEVKPASVPQPPSDELLAIVRKYASRVPGVATAFGVEAPPPPAGRSLRPRRPSRRPGTVPVAEREVTSGALGAPAPDVAASDESGAASGEATPTPSPSGGAETPDTPELAPEPAGAEPPAATTDVEDTGVAEAATPAEETSAPAPDEASAAPAADADADADGAPDAGVGGDDVSGDQ